MPKPESFPIDKIYVPVKRKKSLKPELVQKIAESILEIGQQAPILVRPDEGRFILVEGLHRFEACKALGEKTIIGVMVSAEIVHQKTVLSDSAEAERDKIARLKRLRLEQEAAARLAAASEAVMEAQSAERLREPSEKGIRNIRKPIKSQDLRINTKNFVGMAPATKARRWSLLIARSATTTARPFVACHQLTGANDRWPEVQHQVSEDQEADERANVDQRHFLGDVIHEVSCRLRGPAPLPALISYMSLFPARTRSH